MGISPPQMTQGGISPSTFLEIFFFWFLKFLTTVSVILWHLEAELSILRCLKLIMGAISTFKKNYYLKKIIPWMKP
jgi:hypothetical protein